jgi:Rrf2 family protein
MSYIGSGTEYGLHCLLLLAQAPGVVVSSRDLADLQGVSVTFLAKIFPRLEKAGIATAAEGIRGGYALAHPANEITVLDVVEAIEGRKPLFECQEVRGRCAVFGGKPPAWATAGVCGIHAVMIRAERSLREELARTTLSDLADGVARKAPPGLETSMQAWLAARIESRTQAQIAAVKKPRPPRKKPT